MLPHPQYLKETLAANPSLSHEELVALSVAHYGKMTPGRLSFITKLRPSSTVKLKRFRSLRKQEASPKKEVAEASRPEVDQDTIAPIVAESPSSTEAPLPKAAPTHEDITALFELFEVELKGLEERVTGTIKKLEKKIEFLERRQLPAGTASNEPQDITEMPAPSKAFKKVSICIFNLLNKQHQDILTKVKAKGLPIDISFGHCDQERSLPKSKCHDFVIYTQHGRHSCFHKLQTIYGRENIIYLHGGSTAILGKIEEVYARFKALRASQEA